MENVTFDASTTDLVDTEAGFQGWFSVVVVCAASIVLIIGIPSNSSLLVAILCTQHLRTLNNLIIANITASGLIQLIVVIPWQFRSMITGVWPYAPWFCKFTFLFAFITVDALVNNMAVLAIYRYFVVVRRQNYFLKTKKVVVTMIVIAWSIAVIFSVTLILGLTKSAFVPRYGRCIQQQTDPLTAKVYKVVTVGGISKGLIPVILAYLRIFYEVRKKSLAVSGNESGGIQATTSQAETLGAKTAAATAAGRVRSRPLSQREITITIVCVVNFVLFSVCYGPIVIVFAVYDNTGLQVPGDLYKFCTLMYWIGNTLNPLAYAILQKETRDVLLGYLRMMICKGNTSVVNVSSS